MKASKHGTITYADAGPNTRTTQVFINLRNDASPRRPGLRAVRQGDEGDEHRRQAVRRLRRPAAGDQQQITQQGNAFLKKRFPKLDGIVTARLVTG